MSKKNKIIIIGAFFFLLLAGLMISFAYFSAQVTGDEESQTLTVSGGTLTIVVAGGNSISASNIYPSAAAIATKTFTVTGNNTTNSIMPYVLNFVIDSNTFSSDALVYSLTSKNASMNGEVVSSIESGTIANGASTIELGSGNFTKGTNNVHTYTLKLYFPETESDQNSDKNKTFSGHLSITSSSVVEPTPTVLLNSILGTNNSNVSSTLTTPGSNASTSEEAVLASTTDDYGTSYYYRGMVENNYVVFANMCWRIVRVTGNNAIKLVLYNYNPNNVENPCSSEQDSTSAAYARYDTDSYLSAYNTGYKDNGYIGFMYGNNFGTSLGINRLTETAQDVSFDTTSSYYYGSSYTYDSVNDSFTLSGDITSGVWSSIYSDVLSTYKYTCFSSAETNSCQTLAEMASYVSDTSGTAYPIGYTIDQSESYNEAHSNINKSTILTNLDTWYENNLSSYSSYLADTIWCNDKSLATKNYNGDSATYLGYGANVSYYSGLDRVSMSYIPSLVCADDSVSKYTASDTTNGNGDLEYPIGLLTIDEVMFAGGDWDHSNTIFYLTNNATEEGWWTMTPASYENAASIFNWDSSSGWINYYWTSNSMGVRPAISLLSTTIVTGYGNASDPYVVQE